MSLSSELESVWAPQQSCDGVPAFDTVDDEQAFFAPGVGLEAMDAEIADLGTLLTDHQAEEPRTEEPTDPKYKMQKLALEDPEALLHCDEVLKALLLKTLKDSSEPLETRKEGLDSGRCLFKYKHRGARGNVVAAILRLKTVRKLSFGGKADCVYNDEMECRSCRSECGGLAVQACLETPARRQKRKAKEAAKKNPKHPKQVQNMAEV